MILWVEGKLDIAADGQMELPGQPSPVVVTTGPAARILFELAPESPDRIRFCWHWYRQEWVLDVVAGDDAGTWIRAAMACTGMEHDVGIQTTRAWSEPLRQAAGEGRCVLYRPHPRFQKIARPVYRYTLTAQRYAFCAPVPMRRNLHVGSPN